MGTFSAKRHSHNPGTHVPGLLSAVDGLHYVESFSITLTCCLCLAQVSLASQLEVFHGPWAAGEMLCYEKEHQLDRVVFTLPPEVAVHIVTYQHILSFSISVITTLLEKLEINQSVNILCNPQVLWLLCPTVGKSANVHHI